MDKKAKQLGMNPSTASHRLVKDVLWKLIQDTGQSSCCKCGEQMSRETFSIEHIVPWLDSEDPIGLYFSLDNVSFSHLSCNISSGRRPNAGVIKHGSASGYKYYGCRCQPCTKAHSAYKQARRTSGKEVR